MINSMFVTSGNDVLELEILSAGQCGVILFDWIVCVLPIYESLLCFSVVLLRFILVFSCLVLSVFSTIPPHQDYSSYCLLILVRYWTTNNQKWLSIIKCQLNLFSIVFPFSFSSSFITFTHFPYTQIYSIFTDYFKYDNFNIIRLLPTPTLNLTEHC